MAHQVGIKPIKYIDMGVLSLGLKRTLDAVNTVIWIKEIEQIFEISDLITLEDDTVDVIETNIRTFLMTYLSKQIEIQLSDNVTKDDLIMVVSKIKF